jgi:hypothetical protein
MLGPDMKEKAGGGAYACSGSSSFFSSTGSSY